MKTIFTLFLSLLFFAFFTPEKQLIVDAISSETVINIKMNNGEKWPSDTSTTAHIQTMIALCEEALSQKDYKVLPLKEALTNEINLLNRNTQITGDARSQLHNYQLGIRKRINAVIENRGSVEWLMHELKRYFDYFE